MTDHAEVRRDAEPWFESPVFVASKQAPIELLFLRIETAMTYPHGHAGVPGVQEGNGCPRCNAEWSLQELAFRLASVPAFVEALQKIAAGSVDDSITYHANQKVAQDALARYEQSLGKP